MFRKFSFLHNLWMNKITGFKIKRLIYILGASLLIFNLVHCSFDKPSAPSWEVEVAIPLISRVYTMKEIADDESSIGLDTTGTLYFEQTSELDEYYVGDQLTIHDKQKFFTLDLGSFNVNAPGSEATNVELREIYPEADNLHGQEISVLPFSFATSKKTLDAYDGFEYVVIDTGHVSVRVQNDLIIALGPPISIEIWDAGSDTLIISSRESVQIGPGETKTFQIPLAGKKLSNWLSVLLNADTPGSNGGVIINANSRFIVDVEISDLKVHEALAEIPRQVVSNEDEITITDSLIITEATIEKGLVEMDLGGTFPLDAWIHYRLPDFISQTGQELVDSLYINRNSTDKKYINLDNYTLQPQLADFGQQKIQFQWTAETIDSGTEMILVRANDLVNAEINLSKINFSSYSGKIGSEKIDITQEEIEFDIPADLDSIFFETAQMKLTINNSINFPAVINFEIEGQNESGAISKMSVNETIQPSEQPGVATPTVIVLNQNNSNIKEFISILPSLIHIDGQVTIGDINMIGTVTSDDFVNGEVKITAPFSLKLPSQTIESDVNDLDIDDDVKDDIIDNLSSGSFYAEISNHLPVGAAVEIMFAQSEAEVFDQSILEIGPLRTEAALVNSSGYVENARDGEITFDLTEDQMRTFLKSPLYIGLRVAVDGTNGQYVKVRGSDYIQIKSFSKIKVKINQD